MPGWRCSTGLIGLVSWLILSATASLSTSIYSPSINNETGTNVLATENLRLTNLTDGVYQACTEPDPEDWQDGAGACLNAVKNGKVLDGYYGYPHSDNFVCLRGEISGDWIRGEGMVVSWTGYNWLDVPQEEFNWDKEGRLYLSQGYVVHGEGIGEEQVRWIIFRQANLNLQGLHLYSSPRMTAPNQLCNWQFSGGEICNENCC